MNFFQYKIRDHIREIESVINHYKYMDWNFTFYVELRHLYLKSLLKDQLKHFDRG